MFVRLLHLITLGFILWVSPVFAQEQITGYKPFAFAAYYREVQDFNFKRNRYYRKDYPSGLFRLKAYSEPGAYGGIPFRWERASTHYDQSKIPILEGERIIVDFMTLSKSGSGFMTGRYSREEGEQDSKLSPFLGQRIVVAKDFLFPVFPQGEVALQRGDEWEVKTPPLMLSSNHLKNVQDGAFSSLWQKWEDTVEVKGHQCAQIHFSMKEYWQSPNKTEILTGQVNGVSYFSIDLGVPVFTIVEWVLEEGNKNSKIMKERSQSTSELITISGYEGENLLWDVPQIDMEQNWPLLPYTSPLSPDSM